jgi:hypothetical protein
MDLRHEFALAPPRLESDRPTPLLAADFGSLVRKLTGGHSSLARWSSWLLGTQIQVSKMSDTWLRTHADDRDKRGLDL